MARAVWTGAITFGLVHVPVALYPATQDSGIHFDWLDRRSLDPVGYKRYNKRTGRELKAPDIVKGVRQANGDYVVISDEEVRAAFPRSTQTIEIDAFVKASEVLADDSRTALLPATDRQGREGLRAACARPCARPT